MQPLKHKLWTFLLFTLTAYQAQSQLRAGFDKEEYRSLIAVTSQFSRDSTAHMLPPKGFRLLYRSPVLGLDNQWALWITAEGIPVISIRGTTRNQVSWMENFYAAMVPAKGIIQISKTDTFSYHMAENPRAAIHAGWLTGTAFLSRDILPRIDSLLNQGTRQFYIVGHSQGGAIAYLLTAYLHGLQLQEKLPADIRFKTYCSAAPKPGNLYFAYDYESYTQEGWSYNVINPADWVPQTPFTVQTANDFTVVNPFSNIKPLLKNTKWPKRWAISYLYGRLHKPAKRTQRRYEKYLGRYVSKTIRKALPGFKPPPYVNSSEYVRAGHQITLVPKEDYYSLYPEVPSRLFDHHSLKAYVYLLDQLKM